MFTCFSKIDDMAQITMFQEPQGERRPTVHITPQLDAKKREE